MRQFRHTHTLHHLPWASKLATTLFLIATLAACTVTWIMATRLTGTSPQSVAAHYQGRETAADEAFPKSVDELLMTAHFHLFIMPVVLLVVGHLVGLTRFPRSVQGLLMGAGSVGLLLNVGMPFLIIHAPQPWSALKLLGNALLGLSLPLMCILSLIDLHWPMRLDRDAA
ncbi:MAG: hypothetical protein K8T26_14560 [Lentisphaerae bacterium]|nr:hypothetical protein [Lentisphaerota bacterium]